jgi:hypothetical protein
MENFCAPTVIALATRAGESPEASTLSLPAAEKKKRMSFMTSLITKSKLTDCEVNTFADTVVDSSIDCSASSAAKGEVDNGGLA